MCRAVDKLAVQPILSPSCELVFIVHGALLLYQQRIIHFTFGGCNNQFELLMSAVVAVLAGIVTKNVVVEVLSAPKSMTAIARLALLAL